MIFLVCVLIVSIKAYKYNEFLLKTQVDLVPKILLLDKDLRKKIINNTITLAIVYETNDEERAKLLQKFLQRKYHKKLFDLNFHIKLINVDDFIKNPQNVTALYLLKLTPQHLKQLRAIIQKRGLYTFVYDKDDLRYGFLFSIDLQKRPIIFANKEVLKKGFHFLPQLYTLVRFMHERKPL